MHRRTDVPIFNFRTIFSGDWSKLFYAFSFTMRLPDLYVVLFKLEVRLSGLMG